MSRSSAPLRPYGTDPVGLPEPDRRRHQRFALDLPGRFMRADKLDYPCRLKDISVVDASMATPAMLAVGEHIIAYFLHLGGLEGTVVRRFDGGFAMSITASQRKREKIAAQILRLSNQSVIAEGEEREFPRTPGNEMFTLLLADGAALQCPVLDVSRSGVSIVTPIKPALGTEVIVQNKTAAVVRHHDEGIAVEFINERLEPEEALDAWAKDPKDKRRL